MRLAFVQQGCWRSPKLTSYACQMLSAGAGVIFMDEPTSGAVLLQQWAASIAHHSGTPNLMHSVTSFLVYV